MQRGDAWQSVADKVSQRYRSTCLDPQTATLEERLSEVRLAAKKGSVVVGYSMGGRMALHAVLREPRFYRGLVTVGAHAGIEDPQERATRRVHDAEFAAWIERSPVKAIVEKWEAQPIFRTQAGDLLDSQREGRLAHNPAQLASLLRTAGQGTMAPVWDRLGEVSCPMLCVAGELDESYVEAAERMARGVPHGHMAVIPRTGHAAHLESPTRVAEVLLEFLDKHLR